jgi:Uma2 family endonuclease
MPERTGYCLPVEVASKGSEIIDRVIKKAESARTGVPRYWVIERDSITTVHRQTLDRSAGEYEPDPAGPQAMTWMLTTVPDIS